nr:MAG TPA: hypothetical protein [Caudoviricetes sp.]
MAHSQGRSYATPIIYHNFFIRDRYLLININVFLGFARL